MKNEKGSIILETSLVFPIVLLVMLAFTVLVRYFVVYETVQHGMYETTREVSAYYYLYATLGVEEHYNKVNDVTKEAQGNLDMLAQPFNATIGNIKHIANQLQNTQNVMSTITTDGVSEEKMANLDQSVRAIMDNGQALTTNVQDCGAAISAIIESPLETLTYIVKYAVGSGMQWAQNSVMNLLGQALLSKHIPGQNLVEYTSRYGISDMNTAMAWNADGKGNVEMMTTYKFTIRLFGGYDFWVTQKTKAKGWGLGV